MFVFLPFVLHPMSRIPWPTWPFGPGIGEGWLFDLAKILFIALILGIIFFALRFAFGPGGFLREKQTDETSQENRKTDRD